jgi:hypothetical protein
MMAPKENITMEHRMKLMSAKSFDMLVRASANNTSMNLTSERVKNVVARALRNKRASRTAGECDINAYPTSTVPYDADTNVTVKTGAIGAGRWW